MYEVVILIYNVFFFVAWTGFAFAFVIFGNRLRRLMNESLSREAKKVIKIRFFHAAEPRVPSRG